MKAFDERDKSRTYKGAGSYSASLEPELSGAKANNHISLTNYQSPDKQPS
jgi:hypothetical protein